MTFDTTGWTDPSANYTITAKKCLVGVKPLTIKGGGTFVCDYNVTGNVNNQSSFSGEVVVTNTATLAINAGKRVTTTGAITVNSGAALEVAQSGTVELGGNLALKTGAQLGFNYTALDAPVLKLDGKTVTYDEGATTNVIVKISAAEGKKARCGANVLTSGGKFADATVSLVNKPEWVKGISVVDGDIVLDVKITGTMILVR